MTSRQVLALLLSLVVATGCSSSWPRVTAVSDARFGSFAAPSRVDVLPIDLEVWTDPNVPVDAEQVRFAAERSIIGATSELLYRRGYDVGAVLDWAGTFTSPTGEAVAAYPQDVVLGTVDSLASYGTALGVVSNELPVPYLPARLGEASGSDATLYIGGWGFVGHRRSGGSDLLTSIALGVLLIGAVALIATVAKKGGSGADRALSSVSRGAGAVGKVAGSAGRAAFRAVARAGSVMIDVARVGAEVTADVATNVHIDVDAFGREETHLNLVSGRPVWSQAPDAKRSGSSALYLEMTLIDNQTGLVRWHAHQRFPANPQDPRAVVRAVHSMLAPMPARLAPPAAQ
ncbi:MAG: hypothetical protein R3B48_28565 [Kofleriaceae bacterium]